MSLEKLIIFRNILEDDVIKKFQNLIVCKDKNIYYELVHSLLENSFEKGFSGDIWKKHMLFLLVTDTNPFSKICEKYGEEALTKSLHNSVVHDLKILKKVFDFDFSSFDKKDSFNIRDYKLKDTSFFTDNDFFWDNFLKLSSEFYSLDINELVEKLCHFYFTVGCGKMGLYKGFTWESEKGLVGVTNTDPITFEDLFGYERQFETLIKNTESFLKKEPANNVLLYGARGTGKSSSIKALLNKYYKEGLRLIEVPKFQLISLQKILSFVSEKPQRFIIFIDDLSFEDYEAEYKYLKAFLEGGIFPKPENVLIYATSNRRHLIKEKWSDREEENEINIRDSIEEKLSLADRFGITITFTSPNQEEYLKIVEGLAEKNGIELPKEKLREKALLWERWHNSRSGRTAKQFILNLLGSIADN